MPRLAKKTKIDRDKGVIEGVQALLIDSKPFMIRNEMYTPTDVVAKYARHLKALKRVRDTWLAWRQALHEEATLEKELAAFHEDFKQLLFSMYGHGGATLLKFNVKPRRQPKMTPQTKARANEKRQKTRKERGIMGRQQRAKLRGKR